MSRLRSRRKWIFRQEWFSLCSRHFYHQDDCEMCQAGEWENVLLLKIGHWFHENHYPIWFAWANRPFFNRSKTFLKKHFPNLR